MGIQDRVMMKLVVVALCVALVHASVPIPNELLNEWSQLQADDQFYEQMDAFLQESAQVGQAGGDFEFKCETTCQLVQKNSAVGGNAAAAAAAHSMLQTGEGVN